MKIQFSDIYLTESLLPLPLKKFSLFRETHQESCDTTMESQAIYTVYPDGFSIMGIHTSMFGSFSMNLLLIPTTKCVCLLYDDLLNKLYPSGLPSFNYSIIIFRGTDIVLF